MKANATAYLPYAGSLVHHVTPDVYPDTVFMYMISSKPNWVKLLGTTPRDMTLAGYASRRVVLPEKMMDKLTSLKEASDATTR
jgi:hypothetical protein